MDTGTGNCRLLVATIDVLRKLNDKFERAVNHVINYDIPNDIEEYGFRVSLMNKSEKVNSKNRIIFYYGACFTLQSWSNLKRFTF